MEIKRNFLVQKISYHFSYYAGAGFYLPYETYRSAILKYPGRNYLIVKI